MHLLRCWRVCGESFSSSDKSYEEKSKSETQTESRPALQIHKSQSLLIKENRGGPWRLDLENSLFSFLGRPLIYAKYLSNSFSSLKVQGVEFQEFEKYKNSLKRLLEVLVLPSPSSWRLTEN